MQKIYDDLLKTENGIRFGSLTCCGFILKDEATNILLHGQADIEDVKHFQNDNDLDYFFISHNHEMDPNVSDLMEVTDASLVGHENLLGSADIKDRRGVLINGSDVKITDQTTIISAKGHTDNSICLHHRSVTGKNYMFLGDLLYLNHGFWDLLIVKQDGGEKAQMIETLLKLKNYEVDVILTNVAIGALEVVETNPLEWRMLLDRMIAKIK